VPIGEFVTENRYRWAGPGDVNAFFGLMLDNVAGLLLAVGLLSQAFEFPAEYAAVHLVPGTAIGVFAGDFLFTILAFRLARKTGRNDITAMPLGLDTPSTFGMIFFVLGPAFQYGLNVLHLTPELAAKHAWHVGICAIFASGVFKLACAFGSGWVRRVVPRAGLLGSLAAIALVLISFLPLLEIARFPVAGFAALAVILTCLIARVPFPMRIPGTLAALGVGCVVYYGMMAAGVGPAETETVAIHWLPTGWLEVFRFEWLNAMDDTMRYMPVVIPFALATVVGGIDCTESAAAAGDEYDTRQIVGVEALATLIAALCGGVIQTTPYIGHPAYKAMGGRAAYTLATALFIGGAGVLGYFGLLYAFIPKCALFGILIFIGLEITAQSFHATPVKHFAAVALSCVPAMAVLVMAFADRLIGMQIDHTTGVADLDQLAAKLTAMNVPPDLARELQTVRALSNGFIVTSLLWAAALASLIDKRLHIAARYFAVASVLAACGVIHSPIAGSPLMNPFSATGVPEIAAGQTHLHFAAGYATVALILWCWNSLRFSDDTGT
jgi:AGZA family xanthine/uracil permease-like MFS transporter